MFVVLLNQLLQLLTPLWPGFPQMHCLFVHCMLAYIHCYALHSIAFVLCYSEGGMYSVPRWVPH